MELIKKMEVTGNKQDNKVVPKGSAESLILQCHPCLYEGEDLEASGFCQHCQEYLCKICIKYHRKTTLTKHHHIQDKEHMSKKKNPNSVKQMCTKACEAHIVEIIKFFCKDHDTVGCDICMVINHKTCHVEFIPDIAEIYAYSQEYRDLLDNLRKLQFKVMSMNERLLVEKERNADIYTEAVKEINAFRNEIKDYLDKMEQHIITECNRLKEDSEKVTEQIKENLELFKSKLDTFQERLTTHFNETADLFVKAKQTKSHLSQLELDIESKTNSSLNKHKFERNTYLDDIINRGNPLGQLDLKESLLHLKTGRNIGDFKPVLKHKINVQMSSDKSNTYISSMIAITSGTLLCVDVNNNSVKVVDTKKNCVSSQVCLTSDPWDITAIFSNQVAVTVPSIEVIQMLAFKDKELSVSRIIKVNGQCRGIAYHHATLIVSFFEKAKLQILDLEGNVLRTFPAIDGRVLKWPLHIDVSRDCLYVSDNNNASSLLQLSFDGKVLGSYRNENLSRPKGINVCKDGSVLICSKGNDTLHLMSQDGSNGKTLLNKFNGCDGPQSGYYNELTSTLYLSSWRSNNILVFT